MKYLFASLFSLLTVTLFAQKDFEGMIRYQANSSVSMDDDVANKKEEIKIFFTPGKILLQTNRRNENEKILILIDSAQVITINMEDKTYDIKKLRKGKPQPVATKETIIGYGATPVQSGYTSLAQGIGTMSTIWFADSLYFRVPAALEGNEELLMVHNNHIMLKAVIRMNERRYMEDEDEDDYAVEEKPEDQFTLQAVEIIPGAKPESPFAIPDGFTEAVVNVYPPAEDTAMVMVDTTARWEPDTIVAPKPVKKVPVKKAPAKAPVKTKTTTKSPAKKED